MKQVFGSAVEFLDGEPLVQHDHSRHQTAEQVLGEFLGVGWAFSDLVHQCLTVVTGYLSLAFRACTAKGR
jgi:hypothetical protein